LIKDKVIKPRVKGQNGHSITVGSKVFEVYILTLVCQFKFAYDLSFEQIHSHVEAGSSLGPI
jgi:hypothetical protein